MQVSGIEEDLIEIIDFLNENGIRTYASCDGVVAHHDKNNVPNAAYIAMLKSDKIIDLIAAFLRDRESFSISLSNNSHIGKHEVYGNEISGNTYSVYYKNSLGERTKYVDRIIRGVVNRKNNCF